jgi:hypothetical protein
MLNFTDGHLELLKASLARILRILRILRSKGRARLPAIRFPGATSLFDSTSITRMDLPGEALVTQQSFLSTMLDFHLGVLNDPSLAAVLEGFLSPSWPGVCIRKKLETYVIVVGWQGHVVAGIANRCKHSPLIPLLELSYS